MCDTENKCQDSCAQSGPPENLPGWLKCPPSLKEKNYPAPQGVEILPISIGGRNGAGNGKKKFKCGECGQNKPPADAKPKASADCPMMKGRCDGLDESKSGGSIIAKIKEFFGIGKDQDPRLVDLCAHLQVGDEQVRHHRDVFNPQLFIGKDGYMSPFKVECQEACGCIQEEEELEDEDCEDDFEDDCDCEEEDTCVEDAEGECILEDTTECMDEECKLTLEKEGEEEEESTACQAMNNFIIRVQAPYSDTSTNQTCEEIIARLTKNFKYPEPGPKPEKKKDDCEMELTVKQICVEEPSCDCPPAKKKCKKKGGKGGGKAQAPPGGVPCPCRAAQFGDKVPTQCSTPSMPAAMPSDPCACPNAAVADPPTANDQVKAAEASPAGEEPCPPPTEGTSGDSGEAKSEEGKPCPPLPPQQNDCEMLNQVELLEKKLRDIRCGCPCPCIQPCGGCPGLTCYGPDGTSVWTPPPPSACPRCGAATRGLTDDCYLCDITRKMRSGIPEISTGLSPEFKQSMEMEEEPATDSCTPEYLEDGSLRYKGGFCMPLTKEFLKNLDKRTPPGFYDKWSDKCRAEEPPPKVNICDELADRPNYAGGMTILQCKYFLLGKKAPEEEPPPKRVCKKKEKDAEKCPCPKRPK